MKNKFEGGESQEKGRVEKEKAKEYLPTFDDAVEIYLCAPIYGGPAKGVTKISEGRFLWGENDEELTITPDKVEVQDDKHGPNQRWIDDARKAQTFAKSIIELWSSLPRSAQTQENLRALAVAKRLEEYRKQEK